MHLFWELIRKCHKFLTWKIKKNNKEKQLELDVPDTTYKSNLRAWVQAQAVRSWSLRVFETKRMYLSNFGKEAWRKPMSLNLSLHPINKVNSIRTAMFKVVPRGSTKLGNPLATAKKLSFGTMAKDFTSLSCCYNIFYFWIGRSFLFTCRPSKLQTFRVRSLNKRIKGIKTMETEIIFSQKSLREEKG